MIGVRSVTKLTWMVVLLLAQLMVALAHRPGYYGSRERSFERGDDGYGRDDDGYGLGDDGYGRGDDGYRRGGY